MNKVEIKYLGHACFKISCNNQSVVLDPYADDKVPSLDKIRERAGKVICSHDHNDHNFAQAVEIDGNGFDFQVKTISLAHDEQGGSVRGMTDVNKIYFGDIVVAHLGDLGCEPKEEEMSFLNDVDVLLIPVGSNYTIGKKRANQIISWLTPKIIIPMHFREDRYGFSEIMHVNSFLATCDLVEIPFTDSITVGEEIFNEDFKPKTVFLHTNNVK